MGSKRQSRFLVLCHGRTRRLAFSCQHAYITGGSQGLALAKTLVKKGASISIVARTQSKLDDALKNSRWVERVIFLPF